MDDEEATVVDRVTAKLTGEFYLGQRVKMRKAHVGGPDGPGVIVALAGVGLSRYATWIEDSGDAHRSTFLWALEPA